MRPGGVRAGDEGCVDHGQRERVDALPGDGSLTWRVVATEPRWVALPAAHRLAEQATVTLTDLADEPFIALPPSSDPLRRFWLATDDRATPPRVVTEAENGEETFEAVAFGLGLALLAEGNAETYRRQDVVCRPVTGLSSAELAVVWRRTDRRDPVRVFVDASIRCLCDQTAAST